MTVFPTTLKQFFQLEEHKSDVVSETTFCPIIAPVLIIVGCLMVRNLVYINWRQWDEALSPFMIVVGMPLTFSIADGMALGFISYPLI